MSQPNRQQKQPATKITNYTSPKNVNTKRSARKWRRLIIFVLLIFVIIGCALLYHHHTQQIAINKERAQFMQTKKNLDKLAESITDQFGQPTDAVDDDMCRYASSFSEVGKGDLYCTLNRYISYGVTDSSAATTLAQKISIFLSNKALTDFDSQPGDPENSPPFRLLTNSYKSSAGNMDCTVGYLYYLNGNDLTKNSYPVIKPGETGQNVLIELSCGTRPSKATYFPIKN